MKIWVLKVDITPSEAIPLAGYAYRKGSASGVYDRIYSRILLIDHVAVVSLELLNVDEELWRIIADILSENLGLSERDVIVTATHTHSAPIASRELLLDLWGAEEYTGVVERYREFIVDSIKKATKEHDIIESTLHAGRAVVEDISSNRVDPSGPIDREAVFLLDSKSNFIAVNFACHPTVLPPSNNMVSGDLAGAIMRLFEKTFRVSIYLNGAAGNISTRFTRRSRDYSEVTRLAELFYSQVARGIRNVEAIDGDVELKWEKMSVKTRRIPSISELDVLEERLLSELKSSPLSEKSKSIENSLLRIKILRSLSRYLERRESITLHLAKLTIGEEFAAIFTPAEMFIEYQIESKKASPYKYTMFVGYANGYVGYIPFRPLSEEVYEATVSLLDPSEYTRIHETINKLLAR
ncbi:MAG: neutral/alkaline non-lysosomal ceramidase N-terminal domain-containing protein [Desulfurococcus sp.]|nr:neutral/alkaline non-lysosomal ceramidase N-terminal domain-containing protein [Desulfurococcus sp.]